VPSAAGTHPERAGDDHTNRFPDELQVEGQTGVPIPMEGDSDVRYTIGHIRVGRGSQPKAVLDTEITHG
jgi:hypothetical protein